MVQLDGAIGLDQRHRSLHQLMLDEKGVVRVGDDVDERVADPHDVDGRALWHGG